MSQLGKSEAAYLIVHSWAGSRKVCVEILYATKTTCRVRLLENCAKGDAGKILSVRKDKVFIG